ncbi:hypothetical protein EYR40_003287 [Pleurotus pulmonarius]|nr:hypothetical protein EYR40_003287 [Pleurotus pulmonarius]KAF4606015.1 hypothetical protein EYR38_000060 [Pleurotus pulmonarius]
MLEVVPAVLKARLRESQRAVRRKGLIPRSRSLMVGLGLGSSFLPMNVIGASRLENESNAKRSQELGRETNDRIQKVFVQKPTVGYRELLRKAVKAVPVRYKKNTRAPRIGFRRSQMLLSLPEELVSHIALHLLASQPFRPPYVLNSLRLTCRSLRQLLRSNHFKAKAFGVCFDVGSVGRRNFVADTGMRADQFEAWGTIVHWISERDVAGGEWDGEHEPSDAQFTLLSAHPWDVAETFLQAYIMLVSNDGKNLAQLEHAGLYSLLRAYLKEYLYKEELLDKGWPVESLENSCALWLLWMMTTKERLDGESEEEREEMVKMVLPWVMVPFRVRNIPIILVTFRAVDPFDRTYPLPFPVPFRR